MPPATDFDTLLTQTGWLRGFARQLVRSADADDLVQDTLLTALQQPPRSGAGLRAWLGRVMQNRRIDLQRSQRATSARERRVARGEATADTAEVLAKAQMQRELVDLVLLLDEPYRTTTLLRFFERLPPRAIARQQRVAVATVHSRLQRALAMLRARLDQNGGRERWLAAALPLAWPRSTWLPWFLGVPVMHGVVKGAVGVGVIALAWLCWPDEPEVLPERTAVAATTQPAAAMSGDAANAPAEGAHERSRSTEGPSAAAATQPAEPAAAAVVRGRVIDTQGIGIVGVPLATEPRRKADARPILSGEQGRFELPVPPGATAIVTADPRWATVLAGAAQTRSDRECVVLIAPRIDLAGRVLDPAGSPLPGAEIALHQKAHLGAELGVLLDHALVRHWRTTTDGTGAFALTGVPALAGATLAATLGGFLPHQQSAPTATDLAMQVTLERPAASADVITGIVIDPFGATVAGANVGAGGGIARTDQSGAFTLDLREQALPRLVAVAPGFQPGVYEAPRDAAGKPQWPARVQLRLGPAPLTIAGRVRNHDGQPLAGARVWIADPLLLGERDGDALLAETVLGRADRPFWAFVVTDAGGRFELHGLLARTYRLAALDPTTLLATEQPVAAGSTGVELQLRGNVRRLVSGHVRARDGSPIAGVQVKAQRPALEVNVPGGTRDEWHDTRPVTTDADGAFALRDIAEGVELFAYGDAILFASVQLEPGAPVDDVVITADRRAHVQIELAAPHDRADSARVLDASDRPMLLRVMRGDTSYTSRVAPLLDGRSQILSVGEGAANVALFRGGREVARLPVALAPGAPTTVRW
ncbi:MAG: sigma-70 family RNA polymerase sigma factor [Planctomycetes bacterium]|nr:sigma-70 family RNA polymerase sigma factor [Planctomycetota bacterium]